MKNILQKLYQAHHLNKTESYQLFQSIISGNINNIELSAILMSMHIRGETIEEITGAINAFLNKMEYFPKQNNLFADIVGTGGDKNNTINVSTASAFVAATCGFKIIKHCNQGISSKSGSSDILRKFKINLLAPIKKLQKCLDQLNICFLFAPRYHKGIQHSTKVRSTLKTKTIFNILGPFLNPSRPPFIVIGVYNKKIIYPLIKILSTLKYERGIILHGNDTDEVTLTGKTYVSEFVKNKILSYELYPEDFGLSEHPNINRKESAAEENFNIIKKIMKGEGDKLYEELIAVNVAMLLKVFGYENLKKNTQLALKTMRSGDVYQRIIHVSQILKED